MPNSRILYLNINYVKVNHKRMREKIIKSHSSFKNLRTSHNFKAEKGDSQGKNYLLSDCMEFRKFRKFSQEKYMII